MPTGNLSIGTFLIASIIKIVLFLFVLLTGVAYTVWLERKVVGHIQNRWGPTRVGPFGLLQPLADGLKFIFKEDLTPPYVHKFLYILAPMLSLATSLIAICLIPVGNYVTVAGVSTPIQITDTNISLLIILGVTSVGVYGVALAGWSSNSKYSMLGSLRASAQMISYEVALGLSLIGVLMFAGTFSLRGIVEQQSGWFWNWNIFGGGSVPQIVAFFIYLCAAYAETNRIPFDLPEAETELVAGYHTEYSSMKFAMFFMAEYSNMVTVACLASILFLGGYNGPTFAGILPPILSGLMPVVWFLVRVVFFLFVYIWVRGTLPRFRYDQLMAFSWKFLLPLSLANVMVTGLVVALRA